MEEAPAKKWCILPPAVRCENKEYVYNERERILKGGSDMEQRDIELLVNWFEANKDHKLNFLEKEAIKLAIGRAKTVGELMETALSFLKGGK